jgi:hypothetical protein
MARFLGLPPPWYYVLATVSEQCETPLATLAGPITVGNEQGQSHNYLLSMGGKEPRESPGLGSNHSVA